MTNTATLSLVEVSSIALEALQGQGFSASQAAAISATITAAERDGCTSHGLFRIPFYVKALQNPNTDAQAIPVIDHPKAAVVRVDARNGFCPLALQMGLPELSKKAKQQGIAALAVNNAYNIAALWPEVEQLAEEGLVAMAFTCASAYVAPAGGNKPLFGTNPMAFAWPRAGRAPMVFDQASSVCARGEIQLHLRDGKPIPEGWAIDKHGQPTTDPAAALEGAQLTFGSYKGSSIALMVELLAGALVGDLFSYESTEQDKAGTGAPFGGEFILAIDPSTFNSSNGHLDHAEELFERLLSQEGTRLPGDRRHRTRASQSSVEIPLSLHQTLLDFAKGA